MARNTSSQHSLLRTIVIIGLFLLSARFPPLFLLLIFVLIFSTPLGSRGKVAPQQGKGLAALAQRVQAQGSEARQAQARIEGNSTPEWRQYSRGGTRDNMNARVEGGRTDSYTSSGEQDHYPTGDKEIDPWDLPKERPPWELR